MAAEVVLLVKSALAPVLERLAVAEARLIEVDKYAARIEGYTSFLQRDAAALTERVAVVEIKAMQPGPPGEPGAPGKDGVDGKAGLTYQGVFQDGKIYDVGDVTTWAGSTWHCNEPTESKPGEGTTATIRLPRVRPDRAVAGRDEAD